MKLTIDMSDKRVLIGRAPQPKLGNTGDQRTDKDTDVPIWTVQCVVFDEDGAEVVNVNVAADERPDLEVDDAVNLERLEAHVWNSSGRSGVTFRAEKILLIDGRDE